MDSKKHVIYDLSHLLRYVELLVIYKCEFYNLFISYSFDMEEASSSSNQDWHVLGVKIPKNEVVFFSQVIILYTVILTCIINLSISQQHGEVWIGLLSSCIGFLLPNPSIKRNKVVLNNV